MPWIAYGEFSGFRLVAKYSGPRPNDDSFIPYGGAYEKLEVAQDRALVHAFRKAMLLHGVDLTGLGGMTMAVHSAEDVTRTVAAVEASLALLALGIE